MPTSNLSNTHIKMNSPLAIALSMTERTLPKHIAVIMDGNGRWAQKHRIKIALGHRTGVETLRNIIRECKDLKIEALSIYAFSTENWSRSPKEVAALMKLLSEFFTADIDELDENNVRVRVLGDIDGMPNEQAKVLHAAIDRTQENTGMSLNIALNYGGRTEIVRAVKQIALEVKNGKMDIDNIDEKSFADYLYTKGLPDVDLLIRTSGEMRLSNFLLYQCAYAEFVFPQVLWPDYSVELLHESIIEYLKRDRRFGGRKS